MHKFLAVCNTTNKQSRCTLHGQELHVKLPSQPCGPLPTPLSHVGRDQCWSRSCARLQSGSRRTLAIHILGSGPLQGRRYTPPPRPVRCPNDPPSMLRSPLLRAQRGQHERARLPRRLRVAPQNGCSRRQIREIKGDHYIEA
jgi:hypothetical protein